MNLSEAYLRSLQARHNRSENQKAYQARLKAEARAEWERQAVALQDVLKKIPRLQPGQRPAESQPEAQGKYRFEGQVINLTPKDFENWRLAFPYLGSSLREVLQERDEWLAHQNSVKNWFFSTFKYLEAENKKRAKWHQEKYWSAS